MDLILPLIAYRRWIGGAVLICALLALGYKIISPGTFLASAAISPTNDNLASDKLSQLSGMVGLAGVNLNSDRSAPDFERFMYLLTSPELAEWEIKHRDVLPILYPDWDNKTKQWNSPSSPLGYLKSILRGSKPPNQYDVAKNLDAHVAVTRVPASDASKLLSGIYVVRYRDTDDQRAATMLGYILEDANEVLRAKAAERARVQVDYLQTKLQTVATQEYRDTLMKLLSQQEQTLMLTNTRLAYAAELLSDGIPPPEKEPKRTVLTIFIGMVIGFSFSYFVAILMFNLRRDLPDRERR